MSVIIWKFFLLFSLSLIMIHVPKIALYLLKKESSTQKSTTKQIGRISIITFQPKPNMQKRKLINLKFLLKILDRLLKIQNIAVSRTLEQVIRKNLFT